VSLRRSFPWCALWFLCWTKDLSQHIPESLPSLQFLSTFLSTHGTSLTFCHVCVGYETKDNCRLWSFFVISSFHIVFEFLGCKFSLVVGAFLV